MPRSRFSLRILALAALASGAAALTAPVPASAALFGKKPAANSTETAAPADKLARAKECSLQADKRGLHGKERKAFRAKCKRGES